MQRRHDGRSRAPEKTYTASRNYSVCLAQNYNSAATRRQRTHEMRRLHSRIKINMSLKCIALGHTGKKDNAQNPR